MPDFSRRTTDVLRHSGFIRFLSARLLASLAAQMQTVAVGWQVYDLSHDPLDLGLIGLSQFLPFVLLILPAGHIADRYDRRRIVTWCYALAALCALLLLLFTWQNIQATWPVFSAMVLLGCARAFSMPAGQALVPNLVPREDFSRAVALNSSVFQISAVTGPAIGGLLYLAGPAVVYMTVALCAIAAVILMAGVGAAGGSVSSKEPASMRTLLSGLHFVWSRPPVLGAISLDLFAVLFGGATALLPVFARDILHVGPAGLGLLRTAPGMGAGLCALALAFNPIHRHAGAWMFGGVGVFGVATLAFGLSTSFMLSFACLVTLGAADMVSVYIRHLLVQLETPDAIRGRVSAVSAVFIGASNELGEFESGLTAQWWGATRAVLVGGIATIAVTALWIKMFPVLWRMDRFAPVAERTEGTPAG
jgi:MFS family permease